MDTVAQQLATRLTAAFNGTSADSARSWLWRPLLELLAQGEPVTVDQLAGATGRSIEEVRAALAANGGTEYDDHGRVTGSGITLNPTPLSRSDRTVRGSPPGARAPARSRRDEELRPAPQSPGAAAAAG